MVAGLGVAVADGGDRRRPRTSSVPLALPDAAARPPPESDPGGLPGRAVGDVLPGRRDQRPARRRRPARSGAPPPTGRRRRSGGPGRPRRPGARSASSPSARPQSMPSTAARARCAGVGGGQASGRAARRWRRGRFGRALALQVGHQHQPVRARRARDSASSASSSWSTPSSRGGGVEHPGGVERADQRQEAAGGVGEPGDRAGRRRRPARRATANDRAGGADRDDDVARAGAEAERGGGVVAGARRRARRRRRRAPAGARPGRAPGAAPAPRPKRPLEQVAAGTAPVAGDQ